MEGSGLSWLRHYLGTNMCDEGYFSKKKRKFEKRRKDEIHFGSVSYKQRKA